MKQTFEQKILYRHLIMEDMTYNWYVNWLKNTGTPDNTEMYIDGKWIEIEFSLDENNKIVVSI